MSELTQPDPLDGDYAIHKILDEPEDVGLLRLTQLVQYLLHVPVAYIGLLGADLTIDRRIGSGAEHWDNLKTYPLTTAYAKAQIWPDSAGVVVEEFVPGPLQFAAWAPLRSWEGIDLGFLVVADVKPRPEFSPQDLDALAGLSRVLAGKLELRRIAVEARESEYSLREAERRFRSVANSSPVMILYSGVDGSTSFANKAWLDFTGRGLEDEVGEGFEDRFHPDHRERVVRAYWEAFQARKPLDDEFAMLRHDGEYRWIHSRGMPRLLDDGRCTGYIGTFTDITEERAATLALRKQVRCTAAIAEAAGIFYAVLDSEGRIQQMSSSRRAGIESTNSSGRPLPDVCQATDADVIRDGLSRAASGCAAERTVVRIQAPNLLWTFTPIFSAALEPEGTVVTATRSAAHHHFGPDAEDFRSILQESRMAVHY